MSQAKWTDIGALEGLSAQPVSRVRIDGTALAVTFKDGVFHGGSSSVTLDEVARAAQDPSKLPEGMEGSQRRVLNKPYQLHQLEVVKVESFPFLDQRSAIGKKLSWEERDGMGIFLAKGKA